MHTIDVLFQCPDRCCEIVADDLAMGECAVEELAALALSPLFNCIMIEDVSITFPSVRASKDELIAISIRAQGYDPFPMVNPDHLDCAIESHLAGSLAEFFGALDVKHCTIC